MEIKLTADWILMHNSEIYCYEGHCFIKVFDSGFQYYLMDLALKTINVPYNCEEYYDKDDEDYENAWYEYSFNNIEDIKDSCPELYAEFQRLIEQDTLRQEQILKRENFVLEFLETPKTAKEIEKHLEENLYRYEEEDFENRKDSLKVHTKFLLDDLEEQDRIKLTCGCYVRT